MNKIWLNITNGDGELLKRIDLSEYDLSKSIARTELIETIQETAENAE